MVKKGFVSIVNLITYIFAGLFLIFFGMQQYDAYRLEGVLIWAGALLALLFLSFIVALAVKTISDRNSEGKLNVVFNIIETVCIVLVCMAVYELVIQGCSKVYLIDDWQISGFAQVVAQSNEIYANQPAITDMFIVSPAVFATVKALAIAFNLFGSNEFIASMAFMVLQLLIAFLAARILRLFAGRTAEVITFAALALMPSQLAIPFLRNDRTLGSFFMMLNIYLFVLSRKMAVEDKSMWIRLLVLGLSGFVGAFSIFCAPVSIVVIIFEALYVILQTDDSGAFIEEIGYRILGFILSLGISVLVFIILCFMKAEVISRSFYEIMLGYLNLFIPNNHSMINLPLVWGRDGYADSLLFYSNAFENSIYYGAILGLVFISLLVGWFRKEDKLLIPKVCIIVMGIYTFMTGISTLDHLVMMPVLFVLAGSLIGLLRDCLKSPQVESEDVVIMTPVRASDEVAQEDEALGVITVSDVIAKNNASVDSIDEQKSLPDDEIDSDLSLIDNPLPLPKKHEIKEMDFDIEVSDDDDFDIKEFEEY